VGVLFGADMGMPDGVWVARTAEPWRLGPERWGGGRRDAQHEITQLGFCRTCMLSCTATVSEVVCGRLGEVILHLAALWRYCNKKYAPKTQHITRTTKRSLINIK
jgi:hypothetical protein